jgi:hypothetical protein
MNVTGGSSITLQWYHHVYVEDPNSNLISIAPVWIADRLGNPAQPSSKITDITGWARWFICSELIQYSGSTTYLNPFNISAENNSMFGYAAGHINLSSMNTTVIVPFNPIPTIPPIVTYLNIVPVPGGIQTGLVTIEFMLEGSHEWHGLGVRHSSSFKRSHNLFEQQYTLYLCLGLEGNEQFPIIIQHRHENKDHTFR